MNFLATYFLNALAYNVTVSVMAFAAVYASKRKERELTFLRGTSVLLISWVIGSLLVLIGHLLFAAGGTEIGGGQLEWPISLLVVISVMYVIFGWLSKKRTVVVP